MDEKNKYFLEVKTINTGETHYLEEDIFVPEEMVHNKSLIRMDMNIVQFPIFSKNTKRKKNEITTYYFNKNRDTYILVTPAAGELIPGEVEEKIFIALMKIMKEKGMKQEFIVTAKEIKEVARITTNNYIGDIKKSLYRLSDTNYKFKNTLYSNQDKMILKKLISTPILTFESLKLNLKENTDIRVQIEDRRIKEVHKIKISDHFYKNIVKRGYLVYDSDILLGINSSTARTLYMLLEKIRYNDLYVKESVFVLIKKIPLKYEKKSLPMTIKTLEKSLNELKEKNLIKTFNFIKESTWEKAELEIFFLEEHNYIKQDRFKQDNEEVKNIYNDLLLSYTEKNIEKSKLSITEEMIEQVIEKLPKKVKELKLIKKIIKEQLEKYNFEKVMASAVYISKQKKITNPRAYFIKILENNWAKDINYEEIEEQNTNNKLLKEESEKENEKKNYYLEKEYMNSLKLEEKEKLEKEAYIDYMRKCGMNGKAQELAFEKGKNAIILEYIHYNIKTKKNKVEVIENYLDKENVLSINEIKEIIEKTIELAELIYNYTDIQKKEIIKNILKDVILNIGVNSLKEKELQEIIKKYVDLN